MTTGYAKSKRNRQKQEHDKNGAQDEDLDIAVTNSSRTSKKRKAPDDELQAAERDQNGDTQDAHEEGVLQVPATPFPDQREDSAMDRAVTSTPKDSAPMDPSEILAKTLKAEERFKKMQKAIGKYLRKNEIAREDFMTAVRNGPVGTNDFFNYAKKFFASLSTSEFEQLTEEALFGKAIDRSSTDHELPTKPANGSRKSNGEAGRPPKKPRIKREAPREPGNDSDGEGWLQGPFTDSERSLIASEVDAYCSEYDMLESGFRDRLWNETKREERRRLHSRFQELLPRRKPRSVVDYLRRAYMPYERAPFTAEDDQEILRLRAQHGADWKTIGNAMGRYGNDVRDRYRNHLEGPATGEAHQGPWSEEENAKFMQILSQFESREDMNWSAISKQMGTRSRPQCRDRYLRISGQRSKKSVNSPASTRKPRDSPIGRRPSIEVLEGDKYHMLKLIQESDAQSVEDVFEQDLLAAYDGVFDSRRLTKLLTNLLPLASSEAFRDKVDELVDDYEAKGAQEYKRSLVDEE